MTLSELITKIRRDIGFDEDDSVTDPELTSYINEGISEAEREIHTLYEDYFLSRIYLPLTDGVETYSLPSDIYANKIRAIYYEGDDNDKYEIKRIRYFDEEALIDTDDTFDYMYFIINPGDSVAIGTAITDYTDKVITFSSSHNLGIGDEIQVFDSTGATNRGSDIVSAVGSSTTATLTDGIAGTIATDIVRMVTGPKIKLYPPASEDSVSNVKVWYIRDAKQLSDDDDECDIPEFESFVIWYAKVRCLKKKGIDPMLQTAIMDLNNERKMMVETLNRMVPDSESAKIRPDMSYYDDFYGSFYNNWR